MDNIMIATDEALDTLITNAVQTALETHEKKQGQILLSREAVAKRLGVNVTTLWRWNKSGYLKVSTYLGRRPMYYSEIVERLMRGEIQQ